MQQDQQMGVQPAGDANSLSTMVTWLGAIAVAVLAAVGLKKTHDIGATERSGQDKLARFSAFFKEKTGDDDAAAKTRAANTLANFQKGSEIVTEAVTKKVGVFVEAAKQVGSAVMEEVREATGNELKS